MRCVRINPKLACRAVADSWKEVVDAAIRVISDNSLSSDVEPRVRFQRARSPVHVTEVVHANSAQFQQAFGVAGRRDQTVSGAKT